MKIIGLEASNVKRLVAVKLEINPDNGLFIVGGPNASGKSSVLDSVSMALGGKDEIPERPVRDGASKGSILLQTDTIKVLRTFSASGTQLVVTAADGTKVSSPQALLDSLTSTQCLDPLAFTRMEDKKQADLLRRLVGIDFSALDAEQKAKYEERTGVNREVKAQQVRVDGMVRHADAPKEAVVLDELTDKLEAAQKVNEANSEKRKVLQEWVEDVPFHEAKVKAAVDALQLAHENLEQEKRLLAAQIKGRDENAVIVAELKDIDTAPILAEMKALEATNTKVRENAAWKSETDKLVVLTRQAAALTDRLAKIEEEKETQLAKAKFPVPGLSFTTDGVTYNGVPFDQASSAEQLRVSVAMGFAMQPELKLALIRDGSLLDEKSLAMVAQMAAEQGATVLVERVGNGEECSVIMSEGEVAEVRPAKKGVKA